MSASSVGLYSLDSSSSGIFVIDPDGEIVS